MATLHKGDNDDNIIIIIIIIIIITEQSSHLEASSGSGSVKIINNSRRSIKGFSYPFSVTDMSMF